jgi:hypothetical protein
MKRWRVTACGYLGSAFALSIPAHAESTAGPRENQAPVALPAAPVGSTHAEAAPVGSTHAEAAPIGSTQAAAAPSAGPAPPAAVHFKADEPLAFSVLTGTSEAWFQGFRSMDRLSIDHYGLLCSAPCTAELKKGRYRFSLTRDGHAVPAEGEVAVSPGDTITGEYKSFSGMRWTGVAVMAVGSVAGFIYAITGKTDDIPTCDINSSYSEFSACVMRNQQLDSDGNVKQHALIGGGIALASLIVGGILALKQDEAAVRVSAGVAPLSSGGGVHDGRGPGLFQARGLTLTARF